MAKRVLCFVVLVSVLLVFPVEGRSLFLQAAEQAASGSVAAAAGQKDVSLNYPMQSFRLKYINAKDFVGSLKGLLAKGEGVAVNEKLNTIIVRASHKSLKSVTKLVKNLDVPPLQVQVEAKIIELKSGDGDASNPSSLGMSWRYTQNDNNYAQLRSSENVLTGAASAAAASVGLYAQLLSGNVQGYLEGLQKTIGYDLVASPWITALNHEEAEILIGSKYGYMTTLTTVTGTMQNIEFLEVGTKLKFTPHINDEGYVVMEISPSVSEGQVINNLPQENTTETNNKVLVKNGQSIVIGGLIKNYNTQTEIGVPILSSIPIIGTLFRRTEILSEKREIMVIITPYIVTPKVIEAMLQRARTFEKDQGEKANKVKLVH